MENEDFKNMEEYIDKVKLLSEKKDAETLRTLLADLHPADIAEICNELERDEAIGLSGGATIRNHCQALRGLHGYG